MASEKDIDPVASPILLTANTSAAIFSSLPGATTAAPTTMVVSPLPPNLSSFSNPDSTPPSSSSTNLMSTSFPSTMHHLGQLPLPANLPSVQNFLSFGFHPKDIATILSATTPGVTAAATHPPFAGASLLSSSSSHLTSHNPPPSCFDPASATLQPLTATTVVPLPATATAAVALPVAAAGVHPSLGGGYKMAASPAAYLSENPIFHNNPPLPSPLQNSPQIPSCLSNNPQILPTFQNPPSSNSSFQNSPQKSLLAHNQSIPSPVSHSALSLQELVCQ